MVYPTHDTVFQRVTVWAVANIMQKNSRQKTLFLSFVNFHSTHAQFINGVLHQVHGTKSMLKTIVNGTGINQMAQTQLTDATQTLECRMIDELKNKRMANGDKTINGIVDYFSE